MQRSVHNGRPRKGRHCPPSATHPPARWSAHASFLVPTEKKAKKRFQISDVEQGAPFFVDMVSIFSLLNVHMCRPMHPQPCSRITGP